MVDKLTTALGEDRNLFPGSFIIRAIRDSRYNNSAYAISELIDNSIEAGAERIQLLCMEDRKRVKSRTTTQLTELAVLDNGDGMDRHTLMHALRFGIGTRYDSTSGIGKYGMGLPTSSMSQCKRVDVWSWQEGVDSAWHSWIDADEIIKGNLDVPVSDQETTIPDVWRQVGHHDIFGHKSGTLVVWSKLDRISWRTGKTVIANTIKEVGRIHRHYIHEGLHKITAVSFLSNRPNNPEIDENVVPNDPLYLMTPSSVPEVPWDQQPMFKEYGPEKSYLLVIDGKETTVRVRYSIVKQDALETETVTQNPGATPRGHHARHNIGVSVVREGREITLEKVFQREGGSVENPRNRWWGCEVEFFRDADDLFGVDHNKQMVSHFTQAARAFASEDRRDTDQVLDELGMEEGDDRYQLYMIVKDIRNETRSLER